MPDQQEPEPKRLPALFATIHFRGPNRPDGYTDEEIYRLNEMLNADPASDDQQAISRDEDPEPEDSI